MNAAGELARRRIIRAREAIDEGSLLLSQSHFRGALNRLYYAAFYAARALLATRALDSSRHSGVIALFQEHFVRTGLLPAAIARVLPRTFEKRQASDYGDYSEPAAEEVIPLRDQVEAFVAACETVIRRLARTEDRSS